VDYSSLQLQHCYSRSATSTFYFWLPESSKVHYLIQSLSFILIPKGIGSAANVTGGLALLADYYPTPEQRSKKISTALMGT
jgi:hypothetical protein